MRECGLENFTIEVIERCETPEQTKARERFWIKVLKSKIPNGYNQTDGGESVKPKLWRRAAQLGRSLIEMTIAESLKRFRKEHRLSQREVAQVWGVTPQAYQIYERDTDPVIPSAEVLKKIAVAFNVSMDYLVGLSDEPRPVPAEKTLVDAIAACRDSIQKVLAEVDKAAAKANASPQPSQGAAQ